MESPTLPFANSTILTCENLKKCVNNLLYILSYHISVISQLPANKNNLVS